MGMSLHICPTHRVNCNVNYKLWMIMMYQCRLILVKKKKKKGTILVSNVDNKRDYAYVGAEDMWEISKFPP